MRTIKVGDTGTFYPAGYRTNDPVPLPHKATVTHVWSDTCVNVECGGDMKPTSVLVVEPNAANAPSGYYFVPDQPKFEHRFEPHQMRVIEEKHQLAGRFSALHVFIRDNDIFAGLPREEQLDLIEQRDFMGRYLAVLERRIVRFMK